VNRETRSREPSSRIARGAPKGSSDNRRMDEKAAASATVRIDAWIDLACAHCRAQAAVLEDLQREMGATLELAWHAFELRPEPVPLASGEPRTRKAFEVIEFARDAGREHEMRRALFAAHAAGRNLGEVEVLVVEAVGQGLDGAALREALFQHRYTTRVVADESRAERLGIRAVPMLVIRRAGVPVEAGLGVSGAADLEQVRRVVRKALISS
jgi:predicted DsbA family dithiol-disulfide isomerase